jgi:hypothetical protein
MRVFVNQAMIYSVNTVQDLIESLPHYGDALCKSVAAVFKCRSVLCCRLDNDLVIGGHFAVEHKCLEVLLGRMQDLPDIFRTSSIADQREVLLKGRRFRGFVDCKHGDLGLNFGRYIICFVGNSHKAVLLPRRIDSPAFWDLPTDSLRSIEDEMAEYVRRGDGR